MPPRGESAMVRDPPWIKIGTFETQGRPKLRREKISFRNFGEDQKILTEIEGSNFTPIPKQSNTTQSILTEKWIYNPKEQITIKTNPKANADQTQQITTETKKVENSNTNETLCLKITLLKTTSVSCRVNTREKQACEKGKIIKNDTTSQKLRKNEYRQSIENIIEKEVTLKEKDETINLQKAVIITPRKTKQKTRTSKNIAEKTIKNYQSTEIKITTKEKDEIIIDHRKLTTTPLRKTGIKTIINIIRKLSTATRSERSIILTQISTSNLTTKEKPIKHKKFNILNGRLNFLGKWQKQQTQLMAE